MPLEDVLNPFGPGIDYSAPPTIAPTPGYVILAPDEAPPGSVVSDQHGVVIGQVPEQPEPFRPVGPPASGGLSDESYRDIIDRAQRDTETRRTAPPPPNPYIEGETVPPPSVIGDVLDTIGAILGRGPLIGGIGAVLSQPEPIGSGEIPDTVVREIPRPDIPAPQPQFPDALPPLPEPPAPEFDAPAAPDVITVSAPAPTTPRYPPLPSQVSIPRVRLTPRRRGLPFPPAFPFPTGVPQPWPVSPTTAVATPVMPLPVPSAEPGAIPTPAASSPPLSVPQPLPMPLPQPAPQTSLSPSGTPPLTPIQNPPLQSSGDQCETPQERKERQQKKRDSCRKLVRIKVKAHYRKVCVSEAIEHEIKRQRKKLVRKYITKPAGKLGRDAVDWVLRETGLTPYADQAKDVKKRVGDLTNKRKRYRIEVPGTHISFDPVDFIPKVPKP